MSYHYKYNKSLLSYASANKKSQTETEKLLWYHLRNRQILGLKFRRQYPISNYILDFYWVEKQLAIEIDGSQHIQNSIYDSLRDNVLKELGVTVLRFWDNDVLQNIGGVIEKTI